MSSSGNNQPSNETPILHIDTTTLQAAVAAAVTTFLTHINSGNTSKTDKGVESSDGSTKPGNQQMATVIDLRSHKTERKRRYRQALKERKRSQRLAMPQQQVATPAERFRKQFPRWCNEEGTRVHITLAKHLTPATKASTSQSCHQCGEIGHLKKDCPITKNSGADGRILRITAAGEPTPNPR